MLEVPVAEKRKRFTLDLDPEMQLRLKVAAALAGVSMRQYCVVAIENALKRDQNAVFQKPGLTEEGLDQLLALRDQTFGTQMLPGDSTDIIREQRELRTRELERRSRS